MMSVMVELLVVLVCVLVITSAERNCTIDRAGLPDDTCAFDLRMRNAQPHKVSQIFLLLLYFNLVTFWIVIMSLCAKKSNWPNYNQSVVGGYICKCHQWVKWYGTNGRVVRALASSCLITAFKATEDKFLFPPLYFSVRLHRFVKSEFHERRAFETIRA